MRFQRLVCLLLLFGIGQGLVRAQAANPLPYQNTKLPIEQRVDDLVSRMTLEEKTSEMINGSAAIPRLGVPAYDWWSEGLHGVARSGYATMFPQAIGMAATWDTALVGQISTTISTEARAKYNEAVRHNIHSIYYGLSIWSPNINIFRDPRWGRGQETYGEDPFLTSRLGVSFVEGLQGDNPKYLKTIATPKHFAVHSGPESDRHRFNVDPTPHDLWDTYLPAFRATIVEAKADSIMCAYNAIDNYPACANPQLLGTILRQDWGFKGFVTSDCGAIDDFFEANAHHYSKDKEAAAVAGIRMGTDTNCGSTYLALTSAVQHGLIKESEIDVSLKRLFTARYRLGLFDPDSMDPYASIPFSEVASPAHHALALEAATEIDGAAEERCSHSAAEARPKDYRRNRAKCRCALRAGRKLQRDPAQPRLPRRRPRCRVQRQLRSSTHKALPMRMAYRCRFPARCCITSANSTVEGLRGEYFPADNFDGKPVVTRVDKQIDFDWNSASPVPGAPADHFAVRWTGTITAPEAGSYDFTMRLAHCYPCGDHEKFSVYLDDKPVAGFASQDGAMSRPSGTPRFSMTFDDTKPHQLRVEYLHKAPALRSGHRDGVGP